MKKLLLVLLFAAAGFGFAQEWDTYESEVFNIRFEIPANWNTTTELESDIPYLESVSPDEQMILMIYAYKNADLSTEDLLSQAINDLDMVVTGEYMERDIHGINALFAEIAGKMDDLDVKILIMAATYVENNYVAYVITEAKDFARNQGVMSKVLDSFRPFRQ